MFNRKLRPSIVIPFLAMVAGVAFLTVNRAAEAATETPKRVWGGAQCLQCHSDLSTLKKMQDKAADPTFCQAAYNQILKEESGKQAPTK